MTVDPKLTHAQLAALDWLCQKPGRRVIVSSSHLGGGRSNYFYELGDKNEHGKRPLTRILPGHGRDKPEEVALLRELGGSLSADYHKLFKAGFIRARHSLHNRDALKSFVDQIETDREDPFNGSVETLTEKGLEYWKAAGRALFENKVEELKRQAAEVSRIVLIGQVATLRPRLSPAAQRAQGMGVALPNLSKTVVRPFAQARVIKETPQRLYLGEVRLVEGLDQFSWRGGSPVQGNEPNVYVSPDKVLLDGPTAVQIARYVEADREYASDFQRISSETIDKILPTLEQAESRLIQKISERDAVLSEMRENMSRPAAPDEEDACPSSPAPGR